MKWDKKKQKLFLKKKIGNTSILLKFTVKIARIIHIRTKKASEKVK
jgi:hypothetical protein